LFLINKLFSHLHSWLELFHFSRLYLECIKHRYSRPWKHIVRHRLLTTQLQFQQFTMHFWLLHLLMKSLPLLSIFLTLFFQAHHLLLKQANILVRLLQFHFHFAEIVIQLIESVHFLCYLFHFITSLPFLLLQFLLPLLYLLLLTLLSQENANSANHHRIFTVFQLTTLKPSFCQQLFIYVKHI
jgi:hypothetical protein